MCIFGADFALFGQFGQSGGEAVARSCGCAFARIENLRHQTGLRSNLRNARSHHACADNGNMIDRTFHGPSVRYRQVCVFRGKRLRPLLVFRIEQKLESLSFKRQCAIQRQIGADEHHFLDLRNGERGQPRNFHSQFMRARQCPFIGGHFADHANRQRLGCGNHTARQRNAHGLEFPDRTDEPLRAAGTRHEAKLHFRLAKHRALACDDDVAMHGKLTAPAQRITVDRSDDRLRTGSDGIPKIFRMAKIHFDGTGGSEFANIGTGHKAGFPARQHDGAHAFIPRQGAEMFSQLLARRQVERVPRFRPVDPDCCDPIRMSFDRHEPILGSSQSFLLNFGFA